MKVIFSNNLITNEYICHKMLSKICTQKVNLPYHMTKLSGQLRSQKQHATHCYNSCEGNCQHGQWCLSAAL